MRRLGIFLLILALSCVAFGQGTTSRITGVVTDTTGAVIAGATVTATNEGTNNSFKTTSGATGGYVFDSLQIGSYSVTVEFKGFKKFVATGNKLEIGAPITVNATLEVGATGDVVEVHGGYELVQTDTSGNFGNVIDTKTMTEMPIVGTRGRNPLNFVYLVPGVGDACASGGCVAIHGSRDRAWNYTLDGIDVNESTSGGGNSTPTKVNPDSISEFRVIANGFTPEYGRNTGAQVTMVTKSGTNSLHGNVFWFYQSPFLQANSAANKASQLAAGKPNQRTQFVQNIPGFSVGGPIKKDKTFFFVNMQLLHARNSYLRNQTVYTKTLRDTGVFRYVVGGRNQPYGATGASVDQSGNPVAGQNIGTYSMVANDPAHIGLDPAIQKYLAMEPYPNNFAGGDGLNTAYFTFVAPQLEKQVDLTVKIDHTFSPNNALFVRWYNGHQNTFADQVNGGLVAFPGLPNYVDTYRQPRNMAVNWRTNPSAHTTNEVVVGLNYFGYRFENPDPNFDSVPPFQFNLVAVPLSSYVNNNRFALTWQLVDNFTWARGAHTYKFGFNGRYLREIDQRGSLGALNAQPLVYFGTGTTSVDSVLYNTPKTGSTGMNSSDLTRLNSSINDLLGRVGQIQQGYVANRDMQSFLPAKTWNHMDHRWPEYDMYWQDTWKIRPNLSLDYGVRWEVRIAPSLSSFPTLVPNRKVLYGLTPATDITFVKGKPYSSDWNNLGPSIGLAWDPFGDGKTSLRMHFRTAYDRINPFSFSSSVFQGMPGLIYQALDNTSGTDTGSGSTFKVGMRASNWKVPTPPAGVTPLALTALPAYSANLYTVADPSIRSPKVHQWGMGIQRQVAKNTVLSVTYTGNHGVGLFGAYNANAVHYADNGFLDAFNTVRAGGQSALFDKLFSSVKNSTETGAAYAHRNYQSYLDYGQVAGLASVLANRFVGSVPLSVASGMSPTFFRPYPQALGGLNVLQSHDYSIYHGLETQIERRFSNGLLFQAAWTWSKSLDIRSYDPAFTIVSTGSGQAAQSTMQNIQNPRLNYGPSDFDRTHMIQASWVYELPFGQGQRFAPGVNKAVNLLVGGWEIAGNTIWESGRPITFLGNGYTYSSDAYTPANCTGKCDPYVGNKFWTTGSSPQQYFYSMADLLPSSVSATGLDANNCRQATSGGFALCMAAPGTPSNIGRNYFRQSRQANLNATVAKAFKITERQNLQARLEMQNVTNSQMFDTFGSQTITSSVFGRLNQAVDGVAGNSPRRMQLSLKYTF